MEPFTKISSKEKPIVFHLEEISRLVKESKMNDKFFREATSHVQKVSTFLSCTENEAILFSIIFTLSFDWSTPDISKISEFIDCNPLKVFSMFDDFENLVKLRLIRKVQERYSSNLSRKCEFSVTECAFNAINRNNKELLSNHFSNMTLFEMFDTIHAILKERDNNLITFSDLAYDIEQLLIANKNHKFVEDLKILNLSNEEMTVYLYCCIRLMEGSEEASLNDACKLVSEKFRDIMDLKQKIVSGTSKLITEGLLKLDDSFFRSDKAIKVSEKTANLIFSNNYEFHRTLLNNEIVPAKITPKELFFEGDIQKNINELEKILQPDNFRSLEKRMEDNGLKKGFNIIFYGEPGTGKTESVYQLAYRTGRSLIPIQVGDTKSMWFGESEKNVKKIFDDYRIQVNRSKMAPILLFNEADGIFSKRKGVGNSSVDQTENAIQTIFLQELENLDGILIATTNLTENLDKAFDRRFLYKIKFNRPTNEIRAKIWKVKLPSMSLNECSKLASLYNLTGGQIDNVVKKYQIQNLLFNSIPDYDEIQKFCTEEKGLNTLLPIGYKNLK
jgi:SpoVK/Ycf46/Vps4 family AAA+-type ATPase